MSSQRSLLLLVCLSDYKISVDQTPLPSYMNRLLEILVEEEHVSEAGGANGVVGPCMEYMLQHRVLDTMYTFARTDVCHLELMYSVYLLSDNVVHFSGNLIFPQMFRKF